MSKAEIMLIMILSHASGYRCSFVDSTPLRVCKNQRIHIHKVLLRKRAIIETINDELKNIAQVEHSRHRSFENFVVNMLGAIASYCFFPKKPCINIVKAADNQPTLF